jgi:GNAT superfamily N-acetyltransferase
VHHRARGQGVARKLMTSVEEAARAAGFTLLVLDTCKGGAAECLYTSIGWMRVGEIPGFALNPDRSLCDTVFFYRSRRRPPDECRCRARTRPAVEPS